MVTKAPISAWKNYAKDNPSRSVLLYWTALDYIDVKLERFMEAHETALSQIVDPPTESPNVTLHPVT